MYTAGKIKMGNTTMGCHNLRYLAAHHNKTSKKENNYIE
jgi:hypothetical protein